MEIDIKNDIKVKFKDCFGKKVTLPGKMKFTKEENENKITITMCPGAITVNMQKDEASFEGWALAVYTHFVKDKFSDCKIGLELSQDDYAKIAKNSDFLNDGKNGHINRFLYRALRFSDQYDWFVLSGRLYDKIMEFKEYLHKDDNVFINNSPKSSPNGEETCEVSNHMSEKTVEKLIVKQIRTDEVWKKYVVSDGVIFRQLPVGLFKYNGKNKVQSKDQIFTGGSSAVDLWSCKDESILNIFELKYNKPMIGMLTEIFFYCNYARDMYSINGMKNFKCNEDCNIRGYSKIRKKNFKVIRGYLLYDEGHLHPLITNKLIDDMNKNKAGIEYAKIAYMLTDNNCIISIK